MKNYRTLDESISILTQQFPEADFGFLIDTVYSAPLTQKQQQDFLRLIEWIRAKQAQDASLESIYHILLHLYVLNGSRLDALKLVNRRMRGLVDGQNALLLISGVSGIGKTSLVSAFQERMQTLGLRFISIRCSEQGNITYALWQDLAATASVQGISAEELPAPFGTGPELQSSQQLKQALGTWLAGCASQKPLVILLDDLHWADADSLDVLKYLTTTAVPAPILFIIAYRSEELQTRTAFMDVLPELKRSQRVDSIQLTPLSQEDITRLVTAYYDPCSAELAAYLTQRAEGHPLFTMELLHDLISRSSLTRNAEGYWLPPEQSVPIPAVLKQLIIQRVRKLGSDAERLLTVAAVMGETWNLKIIEPSLEMDEEKLLQELEKALLANLITSEDDKTETYRFSHGLIREVLYIGQLARRRKQLHEQIATQLEKQQETNSYALAHHYYEAEVWEKAIHYCLTAGEQASRRFAFYSALQWYQKALAAAEQAGKALPPTVTLNIYDHLGRTYRAMEQLSEGERIYTRMRDLAQNNSDNSAEGRALINLSYIRINQYQFDLAEKTAQQALKIGEQTSDQQMLANIHACLGILFIYRGNLIKSKHHLDKADSYVRLLDDSALQSEIAKQRGYLAIWEGQYREAEILARTTFARAQKSTDPLVQPAGYQNLAWTQIESGEYAEAYQNLLSVIDASKVSNTHHHSLPRFLNLMGYLHLELGDAQQALVWDQKALTASWNNHSQGNYEMRRYSLLNIATDYLDIGQLEEAQMTIKQFESIKEASESLRFRYFNRYQLLMSGMYLQQGMFNQSIKSVQDARSLAQSNGILKNVSKSHWLEGQALTGIMQFDQAVEHLQKAIEIADEIQHGSLRWKIRLSLADALRKAGKSPADVIQQARQLIDGTIQSLSGSPLQTVFQASAWIKQLGELEQDPAPERPLYPAGLTQREVEVLQLVARGATNQQVADTLHISVRTVNTHMTNILNKIGCDNRTAASAFALEHNLLPK